MNSDPRITGALHHNQFGFRAGVSTDTALHRVVYKLEKAMSQGEYALALFMDIENAFPTVSFEGIERALTRINLQPGIQRWITRMVENRSTTVELAGASITKKSTKGCPQGGILSPFLWNAVLDPLLHKMQSAQLYCQAYADDLAGIFVGIDPPTIMTRSQMFLDLAKRWGDENGLKFSPTKTEAVVYTRKRGWKANRLLRLDGRVIEFKPEAKYLGVILDNKLSFNKHVMERTNKAKAVLIQANRLVSKTWGADPALAKWVYTSMVRPILSYACLSWCTALDRRCVVDRLQQVQRLACLYITSAFPSTPTAAMEMLLGIQPLVIHLRAETVMSSIRLDIAGEWNQVRIASRAKSQKNHIESCNDSRRTIRDLSVPLDCIPPRINSMQQYTTCIREREEATNFEEEIRSTEHIRCYTDGSKLESEDAGSGAVLEMDGETTSMSAFLGNTSTVFQAEVNAITMMTLTLLGKTVTNRDIFLFSDSQAAIRALGSDRIRLRTVQECVDRLNELGRRNKITISWIPGHEGVPGNEAADTAAKDGAGHTMFGPEPFLPLPLSHIKEQVKNQTVTTHRSEWVKRSDCRQTKESVPWADTKLVKALTELKRRALREVVQIITGHCALARHQNIMGLRRDNLCPKCFDEEETPDHYVGKCLYFEVERKKHFGVAKTSVHDILKKRNVRSLAAFLSETGRLRELI
jgi:ribonuclease HI